MSHLTPQLTPSQQDACQKLVDFILSDEHCIILQGHAGTGKTTIINEVVERSKQVCKLLDSLDGEATEPVFYFTAMTHKAKHALQERTFYTVNTFHSLFKIIPNNPNRMEQKAFNPRLKHIIIVDECSYIGYDELTVILQCLANSPTAKFIFLGDNLQLTPVGINHCPIFNQDYPVIELTEVIRQQNSPSIASACENFRHAITTGTLGRLSTDTDQLVLLDKKAWDKAMVNAFKTDKQVKVIRFTNHQVKTTNHKLFKHFNKRKHLQEGDVVINNTYYKRVLTPWSYFSSIDTILADTELCIKDIYETAHSSEYGDYDVYHITVENLSTGKEHIITAPLPNGVNPTTKEGRLLFADLRPAYACTVHKSQGSTYDEVFINLNDFKNIYKKDPKTAYRLLYVAFSRARSKIYLTGDIV